MTTPFISCPPRCSWCPKFATHTPAALKALGDALRSAARELFPGGDAPARGGVAGSSSGTAQAAQAARDAAEDDAFDEVLDLLGGLVNSNPSLDDPAQAR